MKKIKLTRDEFRMFSLRSQLKLIRKDGILLLQVLSRKDGTRRLYSLYDFHVLMILSQDGTKIFEMERNDVPNDILDQISLQKLFEEN